MKNNDQGEVQSTSAVAADPFATKREAMQQEFFSKLFLLGGFLGGTDTYKRTMWSAIPRFALARSAYHLTLRKPLPEAGAGDQLIMAGHEAMLAQWFNRPLARQDIELAAKWFTEKASAKAFPHELWRKILDSQSGDDIYLPIDIWGFPGGQTFLKGVPCLTFEGMGGAISYLEPAMCRYFVPIIQATKARLMKLATPRDAEFGLRAAAVEVCNVILLLARYVGSGGSAQLTSNDSAEFMWPELFKSIGTVGHELMSANQDLSKPLGQSEFEMMDEILTHMPDAKLLTDLVDAETVGLANFLKAILQHPEAAKAGARVDSGDIVGQCVRYHEGLKAQGSGTRVIVYEDEVEPGRVRENNTNFKAATGDEPNNLFPGAGGYWWRGVHRDTVSAAFKRSATDDRPNVKFSNSPGKESLGGYLRVYAQGDTLVVADATETIEGEPLFVKLVESGRIVYHENFQEQAARAERTWGKYTSFKLSPKIQAQQSQFASMRASEIARAKQEAAIAAATTTKEGDVQ